MIAAGSLRGGFADPVLDSQHVFRRLLEALSRPGTIVDLPALAAPPEPLCPASGAILMALADTDTPVHLDSGEEGAAARAWVGFQTGAPIVAEAGDASFAVVTRPEALIPFDCFRTGTAEYPDRSTTLIVRVAGLGGGEDLFLRGPGIDGSATLAPRGLPGDFVERWQRNRALFPRGVDVFLVAGAEVAAFPRSLRIARAGAA